MYLNDEPIISLDDDKLNRKEFISQLAQTIRLWKSSNSLVIGLYGPWGSGKSSILNLLEKELQTSLSDSEDAPNNRIEVIRFDPWFFNSTEQLLRTFFTAIEKAIDKVMPQSKTSSAVKKTFQRYASKLSFSFAPEISFGPLKITFPANKGEGKDDTPENIRRQLDEALKVINGRIIVMVDNVDRLDPSELMLVLKLVRLCSDFPNFTYILAFDQKQVINVLENRINIDADFLEKIVQVDIHIPKIEQNQVDEFINDGIDQITKLHSIELESDLEQRFSPAYRNFIRLLVSDLRTSKRYLNAVSFTMPLVKGEVNYADFLALEFLRVFFPHVYNKLPQYEGLLATFDSTYVGGSDLYRKERHREYAKIREQLRKEGDESSINIIEGVLGFLFPLFGAFISNPQNPTYFPGYFHSEFEREQRIASPSHFSRYFNLRISTTDLPTSIVEELIRILNAGESNLILEEIVSLFKTYKVKGRLVQLFGKLRLYITRVSAHGKQTLLRALLELCQELEWHNTINWQSEANAASRLLVLCLPSSNSQELIESLKELITNAPSLAFVMFTISKVLSLEVPEQLVEMIDKTTILDLLRKRIHRDLLENGEDIFKSYPDSHRFIISIWKSTQHLNEGEIADQYLYQKLEQHPEIIGSLLLDYVWKEVDTGIPDGINLANIQKIYDVNILAQIIDRNREIVADDEHQQYAVTEFLRSLQQSTKQEEE